MFFLGLFCGFRITVIFPLSILVKEILQALRISQFEKLRMSHTDKGNYGDWATDYMTTTTNCIPRTLTVVPMPKTVNTALYHA